MLAVFETGGEGDRLWVAVVSAGAVLVLVVVGLGSNPLVVDLVEELETLVLFPADLVTTSCPPDPGIFFVKVGSMDGVKEEGVEGLKGLAIFSSSNE